MTGGEDGNLYLWVNNKVSGKPVNAHSGRVSSMFGLPKSKFLTGGYDGKVIMWNV